MQPFVVRHARDRVGLTAALLGWAKSFLPHGQHTLTGAHGRRNTT